MSAVRILLAGVLLLLPPPALATSIVAIVKEKSITIAADAVANGYSTVTGEIVRVALCKIRCVNSTCFAASGRYNDDRYDLYDLAEKELQSAATPKEMSDRIKMAITPIVPRVVAAAKTETPQWYAKWLKGTAVVQYFFAGFDTKGNSWFIVEEAMIDNKGRTLPFREIPVRGPAKTIAVTLGYGQNISRFLDKNPAWLNTSMSSSDMAQSLLRIEIQASEKDGRRDVGEPITAVTLTAANSFKVESKGTCYEQ